MLHQNTLPTDVCLALFTAKVRPFLLRLPTAIALTTPAQITREPRATFVGAIAVLEPHSEHLGAPLAAGALTAHDVIACFLAGSESTCRRPFETLLAQAAVHRRCAIHSDRWLGRSGILGLLICFSRLLNCDAFIAILVVEHLVALRTCDLAHFVPISPRLRCLYHFKSSYN